MDDHPVTGVCVVSDPGRCPPNYITIDRTFDRPEDADLWKDGYFTRRVMRYLCVEKQPAVHNKDVLVDVTLINERDAVPPGFTVLDYTHDSREKATKKKTLCVRWMVPSMTTDAITDLILLTRSQRRAPIGYTLVGELNNMSLCYKMGQVNCPAAHPAPTAAVQGYTPAATPYGLAPARPAPPVPAPRSSGSTGLPYAMTPGAASSATHVSGAQTTSANAQIHPLSGIEWKMNPRYSLLMELQNMTIPDINGKTLMDIEQMYGYDFSVERSVTNGTNIS